MFTRQLTSRSILQVKSQLLGRQIVPSISVDAKFSTTQLQYATKEPTNREQARKKAARLLAKKRIQAKLPPTRSPLYADIPTALRYIRAAEVGRSNTTNTITVTCLVIGDKGTQPLQGSIAFQKPLKDVSVLVFTSDPEQARIAKENGASLVGGEELIEQIKDGKLALKFNKAFATPELQSSLGKIARILGPKGLMPNAKKGTIAADLEPVLKSSVGTMPFKQKSNLLSIAVGRTTFSDSEIIRNIITASEAVKKAVATTKSKKPPIIGEATLTSTNGPGFVIQFN